VRSQTSPTLPQVVSDVQNVPTVGTGLPASPPSVLPASPPSGLPASPVPVPPVPPVPVVVEVVVVELVVVEPVVAPPVPHVPRRVQSEAVLAQPLASQATAPASAAGNRIQRSLLTSPRIAQNVPWIESPAFPGAAATSRVRRSRRRAVLGRSLGGVEKAAQRP
jgi:hypothetical protein